MSEYCQEDFDGCYKPLDKNAHLCIFDKPHEKILDISWYGHKMKIDINYCPMCRKKIKLGGSMKNNKDELVKLIQENPTLPLVFMISNDEVAGDYGSTVYENFTAYKSEIYKYERFSDLVFSDDEGEVIEYYIDYFIDEEKYRDLSQEEYEKVIKNYVNQNVEHYEAIVIYAG